MTLFNRMKTAKKLIAQGVTKDEDARVAEYHTRQAEAKAKTAEAKKGAKK